VHNSKTHFLINFLVQLVDHLDAMSILAPMLRSSGYCAQSHDNEDLRLDPRGPEPSVARLAPRGFSTGVVDPLGWGFVLKLISELNALLDRFASICLSLCYEGAVARHQQLSFTI